jgi:hypothetical protein
MEFSDIAFHKATAAVDQQQERLVVSVLIVTALPLIGYAPGSGIDLSPPVPPLGVNIHQRVFADDPIRMWEHDFH